MKPNWSPTGIGTLCLAVLLVTAGCTAGPINTDNLDAETIVENVETRHDEIDDVHGVQRTTIETGDEVTTTTTEIWEQPPNKYRQEIRSTSQEVSSAGDVTVTNGTEMWSYSADEDLVRTFEFESEASPGMVGFDDEAQLERFLETFDVEYGGTETVADRDAHVIRLTPSGEGDEELAEMYDELELWIDEEYWYPLQQRAELTVGDESRTVTTTFEEIEFNGGVDDGRFAFDPPEDAEIVSADDVTTEEVDSLAAASDAAPFEVAAPDVPADFEFETATVTTDATGSTSVSAAYAGPGDDSLWLSVTADREMNPTGESVTVNGTEATLVDEPITSLTWECGDLSYGLSGDLESEAMIDVAGSIDCR
ncbi:outer membrane lipoprotein-sorting protein [Halopiger djelfimassiliensis]|uniref:outer membrane lipoprotein-sorting protein n=1 Tax=Halopiger djelfimassiliensis TaxID=1293047 RepID=UPI0006777D05|nr:outer membrane lipoprotein-sorting protein [Halopiger djelfimassiliensis]